MFKVPRKTSKQKRKSYKVRLNTIVPACPYTYSIYSLGIFKVKKPANYQAILPLKRSIISLIKEGRITYHGPICGKTTKIRDITPYLVSTNKKYLKEFFKKRPPKLLKVPHPEFSYLSRIYSSIRFLSREK
jgi:hypothetical protein